MTTRQWVSCSFCFMLVPFLSGAQDVPKQKDQAKDTSKARVESSRMLTRTVAAATVATVEADVSEDVSAKPAEAREGESSSDLNKRLLKEMGPYPFGKPMDTRKYAGLEEQRHMRWQRSQQQLFAGLEAKALRAEIREIRAHEDYYKSRADFWRSESEVARTRAGRDTRISFRLLTRPSQFK